MAETSLQSGMWPNVGDRRGQVVVPVFSIVIPSWPPALFSLRRSPDATQGITTWKQSVRRKGRGDVPRGDGAGGGTQQRGSHPLGALASWKLALPLHLSSTAINSRFQYQPWPDQASSRGKPREEMDLGRGLVGCHRECMGGMGGMR